MSVQEIELQAKIMITILASIVKIIGGDLYDQLMSMRIFSLKMIKIYMWALKTHEESDYDLDLNSLTILF